MQPVKSSLLLGFLFLLTVVSSIQSSGIPSKIFTGGSANDLFGVSVASAGDVNNDGFADLIVGAPWNDASGLNAGQVYIFSGLNGDTLYVFTGESEGGQFGRTVASAGDVNNDGYADLIVGAADNDAAGNNAGRAYVFSGLNGDTLYVFTGEAASDYFSISLATAGDVNADGYDDLIIGSPTLSTNPPSPGRAFVFSGFNGDTLFVFTGDAPHDWFGYSVASAGDVDNDGFADLIVGANPKESGNPDPGRATVFSGLNGNILHAFVGEALFDGFGGSVASAGDVNNDGFDDLIIGAKGNNFGGADAGRVYVFSGQNGDTLHIFTGEASFDNFGKSVATAGDINNDGFDDLIIGAFANDDGGDAAGKAWVFSGQDGDTLSVFIGEAAGDFFGISVASAGDVNNDGFADMIIGASNNDFGGESSGRAYLYYGPNGGNCCLGFAGNIDNDSDDIIDVADLTFLIDHLFINFTPLTCPLEGNIDGDPARFIDIADLTFLIDHLFINFPPTAACK